MAGPLLRSLYSATKKTTIISSSSQRLNPYFSPRATPFCHPFSAAAVSGPSVDPSRPRNVAAITHVDHGKTMLLDRLLSQCSADIPHERAMGSISLERERGITIASKCSLSFTN